MLGIRSSANPGGASHGEVKETFITRTNYGEKIALDSRGRTIRFIPSKLSDNPHINPEYAADLQALPPKMRAAFLDGNWDVFSGQMFPELTRERCAGRGRAVLAACRVDARGRRRLGLRQALGGCLCRGR